MARITGLLLLLLVPGTAGAQSIAERTQLEAYRDSLARITDSIPLLAVERTQLGHAAHELRDSTTAHLRLGFLALRLGDLAGHKHYDDAASEFQWAVDLQPKWPYPWLGLGLAELGVGDAEFSFLRGLQTALGKDALTRSANDFAKSAEVDPSFVGGLVELSNTALRQRINLRVQVALAALRRAARTAAGHNPDILLARARVEREAGDADSALAAANALVALKPTSAVALHELARARFHAGRSDGGEPWFRGLAMADTAAVALYRDDLRFLLPDSTMHAFDAGSPQQRVRLMRAFWQVRDRDALHASGDRLREHYRRLDVARRDYRLATTHRHYDIVERYRPAQLDFDDRGIIYIRHGTPDRTATVALPGLPANESWLYTRPEGPDLLFHFVAQESVTDYRLVASALDLLGYVGTLRLENSGDLHGGNMAIVNGPVSRDSAAQLRQYVGDLARSHVAETILRSRLGMDPVYQQMLAAGSASASHLEATERAIGTRSIRIGTTTDSWLPEYTRTLPTTIGLFDVGGDSAHPVVYLAWAIPASALGPGSATEPISPRVKAALFDARGRPRYALDTTFAGTARAGTPAYLTGVVPLPATAGTMTARVAVEAGDAGTVSGRDTIQEPVLGGGLALSDLLLATRATGMPVVTPLDDTLWIDPITDFSTHSPVELYFEVANLKPGQEYHLELAFRSPEHASVFKWIAGIFGKGNTPYRVKVTRRATGTIDRVHQQLSLEKLHPGKYVLEVTVSTPSGEKRIRRQDFILH
ncbi:MAG TPA: hypothetical protein VGM77_00265 [Gemmatimonadales bacterium]|jgi:tetratricopeptide (TPR) repeat protein